MQLPRQLLGSRAELEEISRQLASGVYYGDHRLLCRLWGEVPIFVDTHDYMLAPRLVLDGFWEAWVTLAIARYLQRGMWCVDVGACYGYYTLLMALACGPEGRVLACEPNPLLAEVYLPANLALNGFHQGVEICPKVIGDREREQVEFVLHRNNSAVSSLEQWAYSHRAESIQVPMTTVDHLCADWPRLDLVKIDAEGAEALVWDGMQRTLQKFPHAVVVLELHLLRDPQQTKELLEEIVEEGYALRHIDYQGFVCPASMQTILENPHEHWTLWLRKN